MRTWKWYRNNIMVPDNFWIFKLTRARVNYGLRFWAKPVWGWQWWTPVWHEGRGPYVSIGMGWLHFYRGY